MDTPPPFRPISPVGQLLSEMSDSENESKDNPAQAASNQRLAPPVHGAAASAANPDAFLISTIVDHQRSMADLLCRMEARLDAADAAIADKNKIITECNTAAAAASAQIADLCSAVKNLQLQLAGHAPSQPVMTISTTPSARGSSQVHQPERGPLFASSW